MMLMNLRLPTLSTILHNLMQHSIFVRECLTMLILELSMFIMFVQLS